MRAILLTALASATLAAVATPAGAGCRVSGVRCTCTHAFQDDAFSLSVLRRTPAVLARGRVLRVGFEAPGPETAGRLPAYTATVAIDRVWRGAAPETAVVVLTEAGRASSTCDAYLDADSVYLLVLRPGPGGRFRTGHCDGTRRLSALPHVVAALGPGRAPTGRTGGP
ncbi:MAG: hypothetical protein JO157_11615 [Acetobacteraceae bacterium]|nr:hypothetical protein [Acetobacteraceae bacterium]